jgi:ribosomal protein L39E
MASRAPSLAHGKKAKINYEVPVLVGVRTPMNAKANAVRDPWIFRFCWTFIVHIKYNQ